MNGDVNVIIPQLKDKKIKIWSYSVTSLETQNP